MDKLSKIRSAAVYCGASFGNEPAFAAAAERLGKFLAEHHIRLVYGGASIGLMQILANSVLKNGGDVTGIIPAHLAGEICHNKLTKLIMVETLAERKKRMIELADVIIAMPGGFGTWDEFFDAATQRRMKLHHKPCGVLNISGYFDHLLQFVEHAISCGMVRPRYRQLIKVGKTPEELFEQLAGSLTPAVLASR